MEEGTHLRFGFEEGSDAFEMGLPRDGEPAAPGQLPNTRDLAILLDAGARDEIDREIIQATFHSKSAPEQLANELGLAEKTVRNRLTEIKRRIKESLEDNDPFGVGRQG